MRTAAVSGHTSPLAAPGDVDGTAVLPRRARPRPARREGHDRAVRAVRAG
ncbi:MULTISPECIES: hypothetical protein [Streptomyces]|nr:MULTISPECIES: hypothetical protein [Streptomyces]